MRKVKIFGAGSIGNHMANACRELGWMVHVCDVDETALTRMKEDVYPGRYGKWDNYISLSTVKDAPKEGFDIVIVGTPPDSHTDIAIQVVKETRPAVILVEKPFATPSLEGCQELYNLARERSVMVTVGYDHVLGKNTGEVEKLLNTRSLGNVQTMDSNFREYWGGIFLAHPWLNGPQDSYLGFSERGGGASGEHSHAANLWQHFAHVMKKGRIVEVTANLDFVDNGKVRYDRVCNMIVRTEHGLTGSVIQDVVTEPTVKKLRVQCDNGFVEWYAGYQKGKNAVIHMQKGNEINKNLITSRRPEDFIIEMNHLDNLIKGRIKLEDSPISIERGLDTMLVVAAAHLSNKKKRTAYIDYDKGYTSDAISVEEN